MKDYWRTLGPVVVSLVSELDSSPTNVEDLQSVLVKDAGSFALLENSLESNSTFRFGFQCIALSDWPAMICTTSSILTTGS